MMFASVVTKRPFILFILVIFGAVLIPSPVTAQTSGLDILMSDVHVHVTLQENGTSRIEFEANVTNTGLDAITSFDVRIELRSIEIVDTTLGLISTPTNLIEEDRYSRITVQPPSQINSGESVQLAITLVSDSLQERIEICQERGICIENMIYYVRPLNEFRNFRFTVALPQHAILDTQNTPLYPTPTSNHTDGSSMVFVWEVEQILPGQERVYIIKYDIPITSQAIVDTGLNDTLLVLVAILGGGAAAILIERTPKIVRSIRTPTIVADKGVTDHENDVIVFLSKKGGSCPQRAIYRELDISQSLASMILSGLEQRGMIKRYREGRENMVHLVEE